MVDNLTQEEINILKFADKKVYIDRAEAFRLFSITSDYSIDQLLEAGFLQSIPPKNPNELTWFSLTPKGQSFIDNYKLIEKKNEDELRALQKESIFSRKIAILSLIVSIVSVIAQILIGQ